MLTNTFIHVNGIGPKTERRLWRKGILSWDDFVSCPERINLPSFLKKRILTVVRKSRKSLTEEKPSYFLKVLPGNERWRLYGEFKHRCAYIDVETDGSWGAEAVTVIGIYSRKGYRSFIRGDNLPEAEEELSQHLLWVTYNGTSFDLPLIYTLFPGLRETHLHIDLMHPLGRLGFRGGLKNAEHLLGIKRSPETSGLDGWDAVRLWKEYTNGITASLNLLTKYNREDCVNLEPLIEFAYARLHEHTFKRYLR